MVGGLLCDQWRPLNKAPAPALFSPFLQRGNQRIPVQCGSRARYPPWAPNPLLLPPPPLLPLLLLPAPPLLPPALPEAVHRRGLCKLAQLCEGEEGELWEGDVAAPAGQVLSQQLHHLRGSRGVQGAGAGWWCVVKTGSSGINTLTGSNVKSRTLHC